MLGRKKHARPLLLVWRFHIGNTPRRRIFQNFCAATGRSNKGVKRSTKGVKMLLERPVFRGAGHAGTLIGVFTELFRISVQELGEIYGPQVTQVRDGREGPQ
jgi:hypothetical protein